MVITKLTKLWPTQAVKCPEQCLHQKLLQVYLKDHKLLPQTSQYPTQKHHLKLHSSNISDGKMADWLASSSPRGHLLSD